MTSKQTEALRNLCEKYLTEFDSTNFLDASRSEGLPEGYVCGWIRDEIYVGCSPEGEILP